MRSATRAELRSPRAVRLLPLTLIVSASTFAIGGRIPRFDPDNHWYLALAQGHTSDVNQPFAQRVLHAWITRAVHAVLPVSWRGAFVVVAVVAVVAFVAMMIESLPPYAPLALGALLVSPWLVETYRNAYLPDLVFAVATLAVIAAIRTEQPWAPITLAPLFMIRESALAVALVWLVIALRRRDVRTGVGIVASSAVGYAVGTLAARSAHPSLHEVGGIPYLIGKVPFNFMKQIAGFPLWTNDVAGTKDALCAKPDSTWHLSGILHVGAVDEIGVCGFQSRYPLSTVAAWLTVFGVAPTLLGVLWWRTRGRRSGVRSAWVTIALWTGAVGFVVAPLTGSSIRRLVGYGWPAMLLALPVMLAPLLPDRRLQIRLFVLVGASAWIAWAVQSVLHGTTAYIGGILVAIPMHVVAFSWARRYVVPSLGTAP